MSPLEVARSAFAGDNRRQDEPSSSVDHCSFCTHPRHKPSPHGNCRLASFAVRLRVSHHPFYSAPIIGLPLEASFWMSASLVTWLLEKTPLCKVGGLKQHTGILRGLRVWVGSVYPEGPGAWPAAARLSLHSEFASVLPPACRPDPFSSLCLHKPLGKNTSHCF